MDDMRLEKYKILLKCCQFIFLVKDMRTTAQLLVHKDTGRRLENYPIMWYA